MDPLKKQIAILSLLTVMFAVRAAAQELNCRVQVMSPQVQNTNKQVFQTLQQAIYEFMNNTRWTDQVYQMEERIECSIQINITDQIAADEFSGTISVQSARPVYGSSYNTTVLNWQDNNLWFRYLEFAPLDFNENTHLSNLTSVLAYYAYMIIALDMETFSEKGGEPYLLKAQKIVGNAQGDREASGWQPFESNRNRYWLTELFFDQNFEPYRKALYLYHRRGLDQMVEDDAEARRNITLSLEEMHKVHRNRPNSFLMSVFFDAKAQEIQNIYSTDLVEDKARVVQLLSDLAPGQSQLWDKLGTNN